MTVTAEHEVPFFAESGTEPLFGLLTTPLRPTAPPATLVFLAGGGHVASPHRNRFAVSLCRRAAEAGLHAVRFDYSGVGDSGGERMRFHLDRPATEDVRAVLGWLRERELRRTVLVGTCFGARTALAALPHEPDIAALVLVTPRLIEGSRSAEAWDTRTLLRRAARGRTLSGLLDADRRRRYVRLLSEKALRRRAPGGPAVPPKLVEAVTAAADRGVPTLFLYGTEDDSYADFQRACEGPLGPALARGGGTIDVRTVPGRIHAFPEVPPQAPAIELILDWTRSRLQR